MRRCNYTNRRRIDKGDVRIHGVCRDGGMEITGSVSVENAGSYPDSSRVYLYVKQAPHLRASIMVGEVVPEVSVNVVVPGLAELDAATVDVRIIDEADPSRKVLALCRRTRVYGNESERLDAKRRGLLGAKRGDFSVPLWKLNAEEIESDGAWLEVSTKIVDYKDFVRSTDFKSLVLPSVVGQIAERILVSDSYKEDPSSDGGHRGDWVRWFFGLPGMGEFDPDADEDARCDWIDQIVEAFSIDCRLPELAARYIDDEGE